MPIAGLAKSTPSTNGLARIQMKFPFVLRSRRDADVARLKQETVRATEGFARRVEELTALCDDRLRSLEDLQAARDQLQQEKEHLVQLCESRQRDIEKMRSFERELRRSRAKLLDQLCEARTTSAPARGHALPAILGIDIEPDARVVDLADPSWRGAVDLFAMLPEFRARLQAAAGNAPVRFTWFPRADPAIRFVHGHENWALKRFAENWQAAKAAGDEIALHMHPWRWDGEKAEWYQDYGNEEWVEECLRTAISAYREFFGATPASYSTGDRFLSNAMVRVLEQEGVQIDLTLERIPTDANDFPASERRTGAIVDTSQVPLHAFYPSAADYRVPDPDKTSGLALVPLTAFRGRTLNPWLPNTLFEEGLEELLNEPQELTHLAFMGRSDIIHQPEWENFVENCLSLARRVREGRLVFMTASEAWEQMRARG